MAEEKKPTRAERMYGKSMRIQEEEAKPHAEAEKTAGFPEKEVSSPAETVEQPTEAGAIPLHEVHAREHKDTNTRHEKERRDMNARHEQEMRSMLARHGKERGEGDKKAPVEIGASGTQPGRKAA